MRPLHPGERRWNVSPAGWFPSRLPWNRSGLAEEAMVRLVWEVSGIQALSVKSLFLISSEALGFSPTLIS